MQGINVIAYVTLEVNDSTATSLEDASTALSTLTKAKKAYITCEDAAVRWRSDGTAPTTSEGHMLAKDDSISFTGENYRQTLENLKFFADTATHGLLKITYFD